ncbi:MAG TPA: aspartyl protease family protein [Acidobacteriota bacterium]|nr:aspartyl protease family protein [Acidobacteriota bacterium]
MCTVCLLCVFAVATSGQGPIKSPAGLIEIPFRLIDGVIWLQVRVNGSRPLNFPLDTAAGNDVIDRARAVELKLALLEAGIQVGAGTGDGSTRIAVTDNVDLSVGPVSYTNPRIAVVPHDGVSRAYGEQMDGLLGRGFLSRWVVTVDYRQQKLILHPNKTFEYTASGRVLPARFVRGGPVVAGTVVLGEKEYLGEFLIDAPFRRAVALTTPFVQKFGLLEAVRENKQRLLFDELTGVAGKSRSWMGRATAFRIAGTTIPQPITEFTQATGGSMASQEMSGIVGYEVLRYFRITFDFHHMNVIFEKSTEPKPGDADMAGIVWDCDPPDFVPLKVIRIRDDSPASEAGILVGDVLVSIDGLPASGLRKWKVAELLKRPGAQVAMVVNRGGTKIRAKFTLRCLL